MKMMKIILLPIAKVSDFSSPESCDKFQTFPSKSEQRRPQREDDDFQSRKIKPSKLRVIQYKSRE